MPSPETSIVAPSTGSLVADPVEIDRERVPLGDGDELQLGTAALEPRHICIIGLSFRLVAVVVA